MSIQTDINTAAKRHGEGIPPMIGMPTPAPRLERASPNNAHPTTQALAARTSD
jgi:hypothetical protein